MPEEVKALTPQYVVAQYAAYKASERSGRTMATSNWPTVLAHPCDAYAVYMRTVPPNQRRKINTGLALIFSEGNEQGRIVKRDLGEAGFQVSDEEGQMVWPKYQISGRKDLKIWKQGFKEKINVEVKSCSPYTYSAVNSVNDLVTSSKDWLRKWAKQVALYMILQSVDKYWLLLKNKSNGAIKIIEFKMNDEILDAGEAMLKKAERVNKLIQIGEMPSKTDKIEDADYCMECEFYDVCLPDVLLGPGALVLSEEDAGELKIMLDRREELTPLKKEYDDIDEEVKDVVKSLGSVQNTNVVVIEDWTANIKEQNKKEYTVKAQTVKMVKFIKNTA